MAEKRGKETSVPQPRIVLQLEEYQRLFAYMFNCKDEISGIGRVESLPGLVFRLSGLVILRQDVDPGMTDLTNGVMDFLAGLVSRGESPEPYKLWWHSHCNMPVFWSSHTDIKTIEGFLAPYMVSLVANRQCNILARLDLFKPFRLTFHNVPVLVEVAVPQAVVTSCRDEIRQNVVCSGIRGLWHRVGTKAPVPPELQQPCESIFAVQEGGDAVAEECIPEAAGHSPP